MAIGRINATLTGVQPGGLAKIVPTSVAVGSGSGSIDTNGNITFSSASSISINGCFTSTYDNYEIIFQISGNSADASINMRFRTSGTDASGANYYGGYAGFSASNTTANTAMNGTTSGFVMDVDGGSNGNYYAAKLCAIEPFIATPTKLLIVNHFVTQAGAAAGQAGGFDHAVATAYDGVSFIASSGTINGKIRVYGYAN